MRVVDRPEPGEFYLLLHPATIAYMQARSEIEELFDKYYPHVVVIPTETQP